MNKMVVVILAISVVVAGMAYNSYSPSDVSIIEPDEIPDISIFSNKSVKSNPTIPEKPAITDSNKDGISDGKAISVGLSPNTTVNNSGKDSDNDGLSDSLEQRIGTDMSDADTDNDGLPDRAELYNDTLYPRANPLYKDIFVEVDFEKGFRNKVDVREMEWRYNKHVFNQAPAENPNGKTGMAIHLIPDENISIQSKASASSLLDKDENFDYQKEGYRYIAIIDSDRTEPSNAGISMGQQASVGYSRDKSSFYTTFLHELGHTLGIGSSYAGVDSEENGSTYPSVMNYNVDRYANGFSTHKNRTVSDWDIILINLETQSVSIDKRAE